MTASRRRRALLGTAAAVVLAVSAVGPSGLAGAVPGAPAAEPAGFLPSPIPATVTAPTLRITDLRALLQNQPIALSGGATSPRGSAAAGGTLLLRFARIDLDQLRITHSRPGAGSVAITNAGSGPGAAVVGGEAGTVELWGVLRRLEICLPLSTLRQLIASEPADAKVRRTLTRLAARARADETAPCTDVRPLIPLIGPLAQQKGRLPRVLQCRGLVIEVYAMRANSGGKAMSLILPQGQVAVEPK